MKVSFLVPDLVLPIVGIAARMAKYISAEHEVEIVGPSQWNDRNPIYSEDFDYRLIDCPKLYRFPEYFSEVRKLSRAVEGDVIITMKAFAGNVPAALLAKKERGCRVVSYQDEWDGALSASWGVGERLKQWARDWAHPCNNVYVPHVERRLSECDARLVTTRFLEKKFNGQLFPIGVDTEQFKPQDPAAVESLKQSLGLQGKKLIVFGGRIRPHKGMEIFAEALAQLGRSDCRILILGLRNAAVQTMMDHPVYGKYICCPATSFEDSLNIHHNMPLYLALGDVLMVPLMDTLLSQSQMPCKAFEAMAMEMPIVANSVSDLPEVLDGCARLVAPDRPDLVAQAIRDLLDDPAGARQMAQRARTRCVERYGAATSRQALLSLLEGLATP
jgi:glycosyltransferase involved in cell wall biosynthesis